MRSKHNAHYSFGLRQRALLEPLQPRTLLSECLLVVIGRGRVVGGARALTATANGREACGLRRSGNVSGLRRRCTGAVEWRRRREGLVCSRERPARHLRRCCGCCLRLVRGDELYSGNAHCAPGAP